MLSIIIPTFDEAKIIASTITHLQRLQGDFEIIIVDGQSRDGTRKIAEQLGVNVIKTDRGIAKQIRAGIEAAKGDMYLFLHADCLLPKDAILRLNAISEDARTEAGAFLHQYDGFSPVTAIQAALNNMNAKLFNYYSGEQAIFISKLAYERIGFMPESVIFEDKNLSKLFKNSVLYTELLDGPVVSSGRRFEGLGLGAFMSVNFARTLHDFGVSEYKLKKHFPAIR